MGPPKFGDIQKTAASVLNDDFQTKDICFVAKQKTSVSSTVATSQVDYSPKDPTKTPAKVTFKIPEPFKIAGLSIDKLEVDKGGKYKLEASASKALHKVPDLKIECKCADLESKLKDSSSVFTYTKFKDTQAIFEFKPLKPTDDFTAEVTRSMGKAVVGAKITKKMVCPDVAVNFTKDKLFAALVAKEKFSVFNVFGFYKVSNDIKLACTYAKGGKTNGDFGLGLSYSAIKGTTLKAKVTKDQSISCSAKHEVAKGFTLLSGLTYNIKKKDYSWGLKLSIE